MGGREQWNYYQCLLLGTHHLCLSCAKTFLVLRLVLRGCLVYVSFHLNLFLSYLLDFYTTKYPSELSVSIMKFFVRVSLSIFLRHNLISVVQYIYVCVTQTSYLHRTSYSNPSAAPHRSFFFSLLDKCAQTPDERRTRR
ncbi:hypothetical protein EDD22DRAFT_875860 [Suillus occidentalis]|nr:hypothetical protein EDD22DRAFT_875860 [Suillus occidentalis]